MQLTPPWSPLPSEIDRRPLDLPEGGGDRRLRIQSRTTMLVYVYASDWYREVAWDRLQRALEGTTL